MYLRTRTFRRVPSPGFIVIEVHVASLVLAREEGMRQDHARAVEGVAILVVAARERHQDVGVAVADLVKRQVRHLVPHPEGATHGVLDLRLRQSVRTRRVAHEPVDDVITHRLHAENKWLNIYVYIVQEKLEEALQVHVRN